MALTLSHSGSFLILETQPSLPAPSPPFPPVPPPPTKAASPTTAVAAQPEAPTSERPVGASEPCQATSAFPGRQKKGSQRENGGVGGEAGGGSRGRANRERKLGRNRNRGMEMSQRERLTESHSQSEGTECLSGDGGDPRRKESGRTQAWEEMGKGWSLKQKSCADTVSQCPVEGQSWSLTHTKRPPNSLQEPLGGG